MKNSVKVRVIILLLIGLSSNSVRAEEKASSPWKSIKKTAASSHEVCSKIIKIWRCKTTGEMKSETVDERSNSWGDDVVQPSASPEEVCKTVKSRVKYARDMFEGDEWRSGKVTMDKGEGDCEDYAAAVKDICAESGFKTDIYIVKAGTADSAHAVTIGKKDGTLWMSSNGSYVEVKSLNDAKERISRDLGWWSPDVTICKVEESAEKNEYKKVQTAAYTGK